jgi:hypothetical protein
VPTPPSFPELGEEPKKKPRRSPCGAEAVSFRRRKKIQKET